MSRLPTTANLPAGEPHCLSAPSPPVRAVPNPQGQPGSQRPPDVPCPSPRIRTRRTNGRRRQKGNELYSNEHCNEAHELHRSENGLFFARRGKETPRHRAAPELLRKKKRASPTPTPPNGPRKEPSPDSALFPLKPPPLPRLCGSASKTTKNRRPSSGPRKTHGHSLFTDGASIPLADPPLSRTALPFLHPTRQDSLNEFSAPFFFALSN
mmetsp:Transcript_41718/g.94180  ORF Transcript_41718/g.94180 Transcript_41718/m.94180 type:complete len:210 (-) Transcript_41718:48-677(-)